MRRRALLGPANRLLIQTNCQRPGPVTGFLRGASHFRVHRRLGCKVGSAELSRGPDPPPLLPCLQGLDLGAQRRDLRTQHVKFLAADKVELRGDAVSLGPERGFRLLASGLGKAHGCGRELRDLVKEWILSLHVRLCWEVVDPVRSLIWEVGV